MAHYENNLSGWKIHCTPPWGVSALANCTPGLVLYEDVLSCISVRFLIDYSTLLNSGKLNSSNTALEPASKIK